ncbi:MAG: hypothetical protein KDB14_24930 [Planctomycetales bacterium]|nr:hypothetical protein [Planctomycetales bacterium]
MSKSILPWTLALTAAVAIMPATRVTAQSPSTERSAVRYAPTYEARQTGELAEPRKLDGGSQELPGKENTRKLFELTPINEISLDPRAGDHPHPDARNMLGNEKFADLREIRMTQGWSASQLQWEASNFAHRPLYFQDVLLERHGQVRNRYTQPFWSAAHFFCTFPILPYSMGLDRPWDCVYTLGYGRPGNCRPSLRPAFVWETDAALLESGAWVAGVLLIP